MNKKRKLSNSEKSKILDTLEDFFSNYEPKFGEKIKVRRMLKGLKELKLDIKDKRIKNILFRYKPSGIFNLAAETHVDRSIDGPKNFINAFLIFFSKDLSCVS